MLGLDTQTPEAYFTLRPRVSFRDRQMVPAEPRLAVGSLDLHNSQSIDSAVSYVTGELHTGMQSSVVADD